jgi:agmatinase
MERYRRQFLEPGDRFCEISTAAAAILPVPYEGAVSWGRGTSGGPDALLEASAHLEEYDEALGVEPHRMGIVTVAPPDLDEDPAGVEQAVFAATAELIAAEKFPVLVGGDHSVSLGCFRALHHHYGHLSVIQLDAHADLRDEYAGSRMSHACIMARIRELTGEALQLGIRSLSAAEAEQITRKGWPVLTMADLRSGDQEWQDQLARLPDPVYITVDVDAFDWSVIRSTGTPEPGGFLWDEAIDLLQRIFSTKSVAGFDVVELSAEEGDRNSAFAAAKLVYRMLGMKVASEVARGAIDWPRSPEGPLFY